MIWTLVLGGGRTWFALALVSGGSNVFWWRSLAVKVGDLFGTVDFSMDELSSIGIGKARSVDGTYI